MALALGTGCMLSPYDGQVVANRSTPISFHGFHTNGSRTLNIRALNDQTGVFDTIETAPTSSSPYSVDGQDMFEWTKSGLVIPNQYWNPGACSGFEATIQTRDSVTNYSLISVEEDWGQCWNDVDGDVAEFVSECAAPNSPNAIIRTDDFLDRPPLSEVVSNRIRGMVYDECQRVEIHFGVEPGQYTAVEARIRSLGQTQYLDNCTLDSATGQAACLVEFGATEISESWEDFINGGHPTTVQFAHRALDQVSCSPGQVWTEYTAWEGMDGFGQDNSTSDTCFWGGPQDPITPDDPDAGTWWDIGCICQDATATVPVALDSCFQVGVSSPVTGASLMCGYAANHLQWATGYATTCVVDSLANTGDGPCTSGSWSIESIGS